MFVFHPSTHLFVCQTYFQCMIFMHVKCTNLSMNKFCMNFTINSSYAKFVMWIGKQQNKLEKTKRKKYEKNKQEKHL